TRRRWPILRAIELQQEVPAMPSPDISSPNMSALNSPVTSSTQTRSTRGIVAGAALALALSIATGASAQTLPAHKPVTATKQPAAPAMARDDLIEEHTFLTVPSLKGTYRLEALVVRPAMADGR